MAEPIRLAIFKASWPLPSPSPACLKLMTWLRMADIPYEEVPLTGPPKSKTGKAPYWIRDDGSILDDSAVIIETLTRERGVVMDAHRTPRERALGILVARTLESHLYFVELLNRWEHHWPQTRQAYFGSSMPSWMLAVAGPLIRRDALKQAHGQGLGRRPWGQVVAEALADLDALAEILGDGDFFFGSPGLTDAIAYGSLENIRATPLDGDYRQALLDSSRWSAYLDRMAARYWADAPPVA